MPVLTSDVPTGEAPVSSSPSVDPSEQWPDQLSVGQAASLLGLTTRRVRQLIDGGTLPARRRGGHWTVEKTTALKLREKRSVGAGGSAIGRPFSFISAWALLSEHHRHLTGAPLRDLAATLTRSDVSRARTRLGDLHLPGPAGPTGAPLATPTTTVAASGAAPAGQALDRATRARLSRLLGNRAVTIHAWTSPWDLDELQNNALLAPTGASRGRIRRGKLDAYISVADLYGMHGTEPIAEPGTGGLWGAHQLAPADPATANLRLRLLPDSAFTAAARESLTQSTSLLLAVDRT